MQFEGSSEQIDILREISDNLSDPVFLVDRAFNVWYSNRAFDGAIGVRMNSRRYQSRPCHELLGLDICEKACVMNQAIESGRNIRLAEIEGVPVGGERRHFHINAIPLTRKSGDSFGAMIILRDVTAEAEIHRKYKELIQKNSAISLSGQIEEGNLADIIQLLSFLQKTGALILSDGNQEGRFNFEQGKILSIRLGQARLHKALGRMVQWQSGTFSFIPGIDEEIEDRFGGNSDFLLMDALREKDESAARENDLPPIDARLEALRVVERSTEEHSDLEWMLYEAAIQGHTVADALDAAAETDVKVRFTILSLHEKQLIRWVRPGA